MSGLGKENPETGNSMINLGNALFQQHQYAEAESLLVAGVRIKSTSLGDRHWDVLEDQLTLADLFTARR